LPILKDSKGKCMHWKRSFCPLECWVKYRNWSWEIRQYWKINMQNPQSPISFCTMIICKLNMTEIIYSIIIYTNNQRILLISKIWKIAHIFWIPPNWRKESQYSIKRITLQSTNLPIIWPTLFQNLQILIEKAIC